jgi:hypothetical protein
MTDIESIVDIGDDQQESDENDDDLVADDPRSSSTDVSQSNPLEAKMKKREKI